MKHCDKQNHAIQTTKCGIANVFNFPTAGDSTAAGEGEGGGEGVGEIEAHSLAVCQVGETGTPSHGACTLYHH